MRVLPFLLLCSAAMLSACGTDDLASSTPTSGNPSTGSGSPGTTPPATSTTSQRQTDLNAVMLAEHNAARAEVGVPAMQLDAELSRQALAYAEEMARTGVFAHSPSSARINQGENLWAGTKDAFEYKDMSGAWIEEKQFYIHAPFPDVSITGDWHDVGHYTQIIWKNSTRLGCGIATGMNRDWLVCRYSPPGNFIGQMTY